MKAASRLAAAAFWIMSGAMMCAVAFPFWSEARRMRYVSWWSRRMLGAIGVALRVEGSPAEDGVLLAANHVSWIDILAINAVRPVRFVAKSEVRHWPLVGWLASCGGTLFIERERRRDAMRVVHSIAGALASGQAVAVFPEGTVGDGRTLLPFHANLLQAAISTGRAVQPVALRYTDRSSVGEAFCPACSSCNAVAYDGDVTLMQSVVKVLGADGLVVRVLCLPAIEHSADRRVLAEALRAAIAKALA